MNPRPLRLALADDQALVRSGLKALLSSFPNLAVALEAADGEALLAGLVDTPVDVILSDIRMPGVDGFGLVTALRARGDTLLAPVPTDPVRARYAYRDQSAPTDTFNEREVSILRLLAGGYSNKEIARAVFLSEGTVKNYVSEILDKLGTRDRTRAVLKAITLRII